MQVVYFTQEDYKEGETSQIEASEKDKPDDGSTEARFMAAMRGRRLLQNSDAQSMVSKTSI